MKFNWGHGLTIFIICFVSFILIFVLQTTKLNTELYANDYYRQEIEYQDKINAINNFKYLNQDILTKQNKSHFKILLPTYFVQKKVTGNIYFYKPENSLLDFKKTIVNSSDISISKDEISKGRFIMKISLKDDFRSYFTEQEIIIK